MNSATAAGPARKTRVSIAYEAIGRFDRLANDMVVQAEATGGDLDDDPWFDFYCAAHVKAVHATLNRRAICMQDILLQFAAALVAVDRGIEIRIEDADVLRTQIGAAIGRKMPFGPDQQNAAA